VRFIKIICLINFIFLYQSFCFGRKQYRLDVTRAEEILASLIRNPIKEDEWLNRLGILKDEKYIVKHGDTLWDISKKFFNDPFLWRKLWQVNDFLTNPHILEVGQELKYSNIFNRKVASDIDFKNHGETPFTIPIVKLKPSGAVDFETGEMAHVDIKNKFRPLVISVTDEEFLGEVAGSYTERQALYEHESVYLDFLDIKSIKVGDKFSVVSFEKELEDLTSPGAPILGNLMRIVGTVKIINVDGDYALAEIISITGRIERGDKLINYQKPVNLSLFFDPPEDLTASIVGGEDEVRTTFGQGDLVLIDKGKDDGMKTGYLFRVNHDTDYYTGDSSDVQPNFKGEILIVHTGDLSSVGIVMRNTHPLFNGDILVANQKFFVPENHYRKIMKIIEIE